MLVSLLHEIFVDLLGYVQCVCIFSLLSQKGLGLAVFILNTVINDIVP